MPFRQSLLAFKPSFLSSYTDKAPQSDFRGSKLRRTESATSSQAESDIIIVDTSDVALQLPTPSETATDVSSQSSQVANTRNSRKGQAQRVKNKRLRKSITEETFLAAVEEESKNARTVSGETLVNEYNASQTSLVQNGIAALNLPWNMSEVFDKGSKADLLKGIDRYESVESLDTITVNDEDDREKMEAIAAKKAKMEENKKAREEKWKASDDKATRRSSRASGLGKAGDFVSNLAKTVLGKRKDRNVESRTSSRPQSMIVSGTTVSSLEANKKRRLSEGDAPTKTAEIKSQPLTKREKKWLSSGLYNGQIRPVDGKLVDSKNKRKSGPVQIDQPHENTVMPLPMFAGERLLKQGRDFKLPFDVFSPLPPGQHKPDEWRKTNKNVFVGDAADEWRVSKFQEFSTCLCKPEIGCDHNCMNRCMYYECDERNCILEKEDCGNRNFEALKQRAKKGGKYNVGVEVIKTADRGYGVRSNRTFEPNQIIVEYTGEIITQEECESRMRSIYKNNECYYLMLFDQNMIIDATRGSIARFVNHACDPNCRMEKWTVGGKPRMALFAGDRGIMTGEELTYDYNFDPYSQKNVQECRCGSRNCRGVLGPRSKDNKPASAKNPDTKKSSKLGGVKRKISSVLEESTNRLNKKVKLGASSSSSSSAKPKAKVYSRVVTNKKSSTSLKVHKSHRVSKPTARKPSGIQRRPSKLKQIINSATKRSSGSTKASSSSSNKTEMRLAGRVVSTTSASEALIVKTTTETAAHAKKRAAAVATLGRSGSIKDKTETLKRGVVRTVRGAQSGKVRSIKLVD